MDDVSDRVRKVLQQSLLRKERKILPRSSLIDDLGITNLDRFEILMNLESEFHCELEEEELVLVKTVQDITDLVNAHPEAR